jgi:hypothetical protein
LCGCGTWSLTLREEYKLGVYERKALRERERERETDRWRKLHNEEVVNVYSSPNIIKEIKLWRMRRTRYVARMEDMRDTYRNVHKVKKFVWVFTVLRF